jgi:4-amino-4-deoxy-L-arabinose transferase-like glycosyltransferase
MRQPRTWLWLLCTLLFAAATRLAYLLFYRANDPLYEVPISDAKIYHDWATALASGAGWEQSAFYQAPGYPYLLSIFYRLFGAEPVVGYIMQMVLGLLSILLIFRIASRAYDRRAGLIAAALASLYGLHPYYETKLLTGTTSLFLACLLVDRLQSADEWPKELGYLSAGLALGLASVVRPTFLLLIPLVAFWIVADRSAAWSHRLRRALLCMLCAAAVIAPVTIRNYLVSGELVLISNNGGVTFYQGNNHRSWGLYSAPGMSGKISHQREESREIAEEARGQPLTDAEVSRFYYGRGFAYIKEDPLRYLCLVAKKAFFALDDYEHPLECSPRLDGNPVRYLLPLSFAPLLVLALMRIFSSQRVGRREILILFLLVPPAVTALLFFAASRYRLPATAPLLALAGCGLIALVERLRGGWRRCWAPLLLALLVATFSYVKLPPVGDKGYRAVSVSSATNIGYAYAKTGRLEQAVSAYRRAIEWNPAYPTAHHELGQVLMTLGRMNEAEESFNEAIRLKPGLAEAHFDIGNLYLKTNRLGQAARAFFDALRIDPQYEEAGNNLVGTCLELGRYQMAIRTWHEMKGRGLKVHPGIESWMRRNATGSGQQVREEDAEADGDQNDAADDLHPLAEGGP